MAKYNDSLVGMIAHLEPSEPVVIIAKQLNIPVSSIREIVAVYVHPAHQRKGIGSQLFSYMGTALRERHI